MLHCRYLPSVDPLVAEMLLVPLRRHACARGRTICADHALSMQDPAQGAAISASHRKAKILLRVSADSREPWMQSQDETIFV